MNALALTFSLRVSVPPRERFEALMNRHYPAWREARAELNELPLSAESWAGEPVGT